MERNINNEIHSKHYFEIIIHYLLTNGAMVQWYGLLMEQWSSGMAAGFPVQGFPAQNH